MREWQKDFEDIILLHSKPGVALASVREEKTIAQLTQQYSVHPNQISDWKRRLLAGAQNLFEKAGPQWVSQMSIAKLTGCTQRLAS